MINLDSPIEDLRNSGIISVRVANACINGQLKTLKELFALNKMELLKIRNCGYKTIMEIESLRDRYNNSRFNNLNRIPSNDNDLLTPEKDNDIVNLKEFYEQLNAYEKKKLKETIELTFEKLNKRVKNTFPSFRNIEKILPYLNSISDFKIIRKIPCGQKSLFEIKSYLTEVKLLFYHYIEDISSSSQEQREVLKFKESFPFLELTECNRIVKFISEEAQMPVLYIIYKFILRSTKKKLCILRDYYGIGQKPVSLSLISDSYNLTPSRIRQMVASEIKLPLNIEKVYEKDFFNKITGVVAEDDPIWEQLPGKTLCDEDNIDIFLITSLLLSGKVLFQINPESKRYIIEKEIISNVKAKTILRTIGREIERKRTTLSTIDILCYIKFEDLKYSKKVNLLCPIFSEFIQKKYGIKADDNRYLVLMPNSIDIPKAIEQILSDHGEPMNVDQLMETFNRYYPNQEFHSKMNFKTYIFKNPNIKSKGKTGFYVLDNWKNHFTGSITSYIKYVLSSFKEPLYVDILVDFIKEQFPNTNKKSILSLISSDETEQVVVYEGNLVGLRKNNYNKSLREKNVVKKESFSEKWNSYRDFVATYKRHPFLSSSSEEEQTLSRWLYRFLKTDENFNEENVDMVNSFLKETKLLPQNKKEYNFKQTCDQIKVIATKTFALPIREKNEYEYNWLKKNSKLYHTFRDNRKLYFLDLIEFLKNFGFYIGQQERELPKIEVQQKEVEDFNRTKNVKSNTIEYSNCTSSNVTNTARTFYIRTIGCNACGILTPHNQIVICKGSLIRTDVTNTYNRKEFRNQLLKWYCTKTPNGYIANNDLPPMSPSRASGFVQGRCSNGKRDWKDKDGNELSKYL